MRAADSLWLIFLLSLLRKDSFQAAFDEFLSHVRLSIDKFSTITENQTGVTLANSTFVTVASKSLTKGYYVIAGTVQFSSDENGMRILILDNSETDTNTEINSIVVKGRGTLQKVRCMKITASTTIYLRGYQSSGSSMSGVRGYLEIMKVG